MIDRLNFCYHCVHIIELEDDDQHYFKNTTGLNIHFSDTENMKYYH